MKKVFLSISLLFLYLLGISQAPTAGLVAYYPFSGNANDASPSGNHGVVNGAVLTTDRYGVAGQAYLFNGASIISASDNNLPLGNNPRTLAAWMYMTQRQTLINAGNPVHLFKYGNEISQTNYCNTGLWGNVLRFSNQSAPPDGDYTFYHPVNEWFHVLIRLNPNNSFDYFINGRLAYSANMEIWNTTSIGSILFGEFLNNGKMDEIRIYNRALCDAEIGQLYTAEAPPILPDLSLGLAAYFPFSGNAADASGSGNNATVAGATLTEDRNGTPNSAYYFNGSSYMNVGSQIPASLQMTSEVSVAATINITAAGDGARILRAGCNCGGNSGYDFYALPFGSGYQLAAIFGDGTMTTNVQLEFNKWYNVVMTASAASMDIYVNGIHIANNLSGTITPPTSGLSYNGYPFLIGVKDLVENNGYQNGKLDEIRVYNRVLRRDEIELLNAGYYTYGSITWTGAVPAMDLESAQAFDHLGSKKIIQALQVTERVNSTIRKDELAKILFRGLFEPDTLAVTPVEYAPNPFIDLQPANSAYVKEAKALSYLEYGDGISVFKREFTHFRPQFPILRKYVIKAMLETFNIKPFTPANAPVPDCWYNDVPVSDDMYYYILKAREMGFVKQQTSFNGNSPITRKEAFLVLYRILKYLETTSRPVPVPADYFMPSNIRPDNFARNLGISDGNFNAYTKTSFAVAGLMPLSFAHSYNSAYTELPDSSYNIIEPLGKGWTHNYNCYLQRVADDIDSNIRYVITWGDGSLNSFLENGGVYTPESTGLYATLTYDAGTNEYTYKTKSQVRYIFKRFVLSTRTIWVLHRVSDRNNNTVTLTWTPFPVGPAPSTIRLFKVEDPSGRYLQFAYETADPSKIKTVSAVTGSLTRSIGFAYENGFSDLRAYINVFGDSTLYLYEDSLDLTRNHLLKQIRLPRGNVVDNTYEQRKFKSAQMAGQYQTNVNLSLNYTAGNNINFSEADITTLRAGVSLSTRVRQDQLGNIKTATTPTGDLSMVHGDPAHPTKPTFFSNSVNQLSASTVYDAQGNVTSVTKTGAGINLKDSFTYNAFNDILTYINARGFKTEFTYNGTGNLTKIKDAMGNETNMLVNGNGTVGRVTNPEGIFTDFLYDVYGNTTQTRLMNVITSSAAYDDASRMIQKTDPNGTVTTMGYDANDRVLQIIVDPGGLNNTVKYHYDKNDNLDTITNPKGGKTSLTYNAFDQMVEYRFGGFSKTYTYNEDGTLSAYTNQNGQGFGYAYNSDGTLQSDGYAQYAYDTEFNLQSITHSGTGKAVSFGYDALKRTTKVSYADFAADSVVYTYDNNNNITSMKYPGGFTVGYEYDSLDRLKRVFNIATSTNYATYTYYKDGRIKEQVNGNGTKTVYRYDSLGRLDSIGNYTATNANIASYKFTLDALGNHTSETHYEPALPLMAALPTEGYSYVHDSLNRMVSRGETSFTYDNNGNHLTATGDWTSEFTFDSKDNLLTSTAPILSCEYDALENRRRKNDTLFVLDILGGSNVLMETDASGNPLSYYIHGLGLICRLDASQANPAYYHYDYRGSTTAITNNSGVTTHSYRYGAFGEMMLAFENGFRNPYRYVGKYGVQYEGDSLYFMRARYYNPMKGRFLGEDPVWNSNLYSYSENQSVNYSDYNGGKRKQVSQQDSKCNGCKENETKQAVSSHTYQKRVFDSGKLMLVGSDDNPELSLEITVSASVELSAKIGLQSIKPLKIASVLGGSVELSTELGVSGEVALSYSNKVALGENEQARLLIDVFYQLQTNAMCLGGQWFYLQKKLITGIKPDFKKESIK